MARRVVQIVAGAALAWIVLLVVLGFTHGGRVGGRVAERIGDSLQGTATFGDADLALVRGGLTLERLTVRRDDAIGKLSLEVADVSCDLPPLGLALVDRDCGELVVGGMRLEVSALALFRIKQAKHPPTRAQRVVIRDAALGFAPSAFLPGLGGVQIRIERAVAGPTQFRTPLSWIFALQELRASFELPAGIAVHLVYRGGRSGGSGVMSASGSVFGAGPVEIPVTLPVRDATEDARAELERLVQFGKGVAERLVARRAAEWLRSKLPGGKPDPSAHRR
jgi:hypothetical protein